MKKTTKSGSLRAQKLEPVDPGRVTMELLRRFEPQGHTGRRQFMAALTAMVGGAPILAHATGPIPYDLDETEGKKYPPQHSQKVMEPVNVHEIQAVSEKNLALGTYEYITGGAEDEYTLLGNLEAYQRTRLRQHVAVDVSTVDTSLELLGQKLKYPIMLDPRRRTRSCPTATSLQRLARMEPVRSTVSLLPFRS